MEKTSEAVTEEGLSYRNAGKMGANRFVPNYWLFQRRAAERVAWRVTSAPPALTRVSGDWEAA